MEYYCRDPAVPSIMIKVNRSQYMDEKRVGGCLPSQTCSFAWPGA